MKGDPRFFFLLVMADKAWLDVKDVGHIVQLATCS